MQIPPRLPPGSSSFSHPKEGKVGGQETGRGEKQNPFLNYSEGYAGGRIKGFSSLRGLIHQKFLISGTPIPGTKELLIIERFLSEGTPLQYLSRIAIAKQLMEKNLPLSFKVLRSFYRVLEGVESEETSKREIHLSTEASAAPGQATMKDPADDLKMRKLLKEFNQKKNRKGKWVVLPFTCSLEGNSYHGCLRLQVGERSEIPTKLVFSLRRRSVETFPWYFVWFPNEPKRPIRMYPPLQKGKVLSLPAELLEIFRKKLRKVGFILDDNKNSSTGFDGFDEIEGNSQNIDVWI